MNPCMRGRLGLSVVAALALIVVATVACSGIPGQGQASTTVLPTTVPSPLPSRTPSPSMTAQNRDQTGNVRLYFDWGPAEIKVLEGLLAQFQSDHPGIQIQLTFFPEPELREQGQAALASESPPTLLLGPSAWGRELSSRGLIRGLSDSLSSDVLGRIHPMALPQAAPGGGMVGLPLELQGIVLYRNGAIMGDRPGSVDELVVAARALQTDEVLGASFDFSLLNVLPFLHTCGGEVDPDPGGPPFAMGTGLCWLRLLDRLGRSGPPVFDSPDDVTAFREGRSALLLESSELFTMLQEDLGEENLQIDPWPGYPLSEGNLLGYVWTETMYFAADMSQTDFEASWALATFLLSPESQQELATARQVHHQSVLRELPSDDAISVRLRGVFEAGIRLPEEGALDRIETPLETAIRLVVGAGGDPDLALELALTEIANTSPDLTTPTPSPTPIN